MTDKNTTAKEHPHLRNAAVRIIGYTASVLAVVMYVDNLAGHPGNPIQPFAAMLNCIMWSAYGLLPKKKDWPIVIANVPGVFLAATAFLTALFHG